MEQAMRQSPNLDFEGDFTSLLFLSQPKNPNIILVTWKPFYLNPNIAPGQSEDLREHLINKYGEAMVKRFDAPSNPLSTAGNAVGIKFNTSRRVGRHPSNLCTFN